MAEDGEDIFTFLNLRPIRKTTGQGSGVIRDNEYSGAVVTNGGGVVGGMLTDIDLFSSRSPSAVGKAVFRSVRRGDSALATVKDLERILLRRPNVAGVGNLAPLLQKIGLNASGAQKLSRLQSRPQTPVDGSILVFPGGLDDIQVPLVPSLTRLRADLETYLPRFLLNFGVDFDPLGNNSSVPEPMLSPLVHMVFSVAGGSYSDDFAISKRILFDALYGLTVMRKFYPADPAPAISGLQTLNALERLALAEFAIYLARVRYNADLQADVALLTQTLANAWPEIGFGQLDLKPAMQRLKDVEMPTSFDAAGPDRVMSMLPLLPPIFARLRAAFAPMNSLRPVGIGDLMVVRQTFLGYRKGEIAQIETVMSGETKERTVRRLDRTEDNQSFSMSEDSEATTESVNAERFEMRREAEAVLKMDVTAGMTASVEYKGSPVVSTVTANANLSIGKSESEKVASGFARDVTERAVSRVQRRVSQSRTRTQISEIEENSLHRLSNTTEGDHVNGAYRWVDKIYRAEIRNYGRRLMFELIVPEPAAFFVQQRLLSYAASVDLPPYPTKPKPDPVNAAAVAGVSNPGQITPAKWAELNQIYFLDDLPPPAERIDGVEIVRSDGGRYFSKSTRYWDGGFATDDFANCRILNRPAGYDPIAIGVSGQAVYRGKFESEPNWQNEFGIRIGGTNVFTYVDETRIYFDFNGGAQSLPAGFQIPDGFGIAILTKTCDRFNVTLTASFQIRPATMQSWRETVFASLVDARLRPVGDTGAPIPDPDVLAYLKTLREAERPAVAKLIQGGSSLWNQRRIEQEIKRLSISQFTREFDTQPNDDQISGFETMGELALHHYRYPRLAITPGTDAAPATQTGFDMREIPLTGYAVPDVGLSRSKGTHIQFLEHAFEWQNLSYVFYPYYWATPPKWVELIDREDEADSSFTQFLQAGAARILIAVRPGFEDAVMHYIATREPWSGGAAPVIGDDLHLPIHEEIRELTEDRATTGLPVGEPWTVTVPTSLIFLESNAYPLPDLYVPPVTPV